MRSWSETENRSHEMESRLWITEMLFYSPALFWGREKGESMCDTTKRKIAECVKLLMRRKEISKITIQDIMNETHMSRQSFYYHFKDIYDVL